MRRIHTAVGPRGVRGRVGFMKHRSKICLGIYLMLVVYDEVKSASILLKNLPFDFWNVAIGWVSNMEGDDSSIFPTYLGPIRPWGTISYQGVRECQS